MVDPNLASSINSDSISSPIRDGKRIRESLQQVDQGKGRGLVADYSPDEVLVQLSYVDVLDDNVRDSINHS